MRVLLNSFVVGSLLVAAPSMANAADDFEPSQAAYDWSGLYLGAHVGWGWASKEWTLIDNAGPGACGQCGSVVTDYSISGVLGGVQAGYNHQMGNWVFGVEGEFSFSGIDGVGTWTGGNPAGPRNGTTDMNWLATVGPKVGWAMDRALFSVEGGLAVADEDYSHLGNNGNVYTGGSTRTGWFLGAGAEVALDVNWSVEFEYNYINLGTDRVSLTRSGGPGPAIFDIEQDMHTAKIGVNYRF